MDIQSYRDYPAEKSVCGVSRQLSIRERLENNKQDLEANLKRVNDALEALDAAPETAKVLELLSKV